MIFHKYTEKKNRIPGLFLLLILIPVLWFMVTMPVYAEGPGDIPGNEPRLGDPTQPYPADGPSITGNSAIVMDLDTGDILFEQDPHRQAEPASTTKLLTAILSVDNLSMGDMITVTGDVYDNLIEDAVTVGPTPGEIISVKDLLYSLLLPSANDAANVLATAVSGSPAAFAELMNKTLADLGCTETHFANANGLPDENHYTTVYDMAKIAREAYTRSTIREIIHTPSYWTSSTNVSGERELWTTDELLYDVTDLYYEYCTGGKTGYTGSAGYTMVSFAEKNGRRIVSVVFGCPSSFDRFRDAARLMDYGLNEYHLIRPLKDFSPLTETEAETDNAIQKNFTSTLGHVLPEFGVDQNTRLFTRSSVYAEDIEKKVKLSGVVNNGQVGEVILSYHGKDVGSVPIIAVTDQTPEKENGLYLSFDPYTPAPEPVATVDKKNLLRDFLGTWGPGILVILGIGGMAFFIVYFVRKRQEQERVRVRRYMGNGEVRNRNVRTRDTAPDSAFSEEYPEPSRNTYSRTSGSTSRRTAGNTSRETMRNTSRSAGNSPRETARSTSRTAGNSPQTPDTLSQKELLRRKRAARYQAAHGGDPNAKGNRNQ